ncbi:hypothetical protein SPURM210S_06957 [Streptomyces purpurascens]
MRHPPHSVLLVSDGPVALVRSAVPPVFPAREATAACTAGCAVTSQWERLFRGLEPSKGRDTDEPSRTDDAPAQRDCVHRGCEPRGGAQHTSRPGDLQLDGGHEAPA